jgi:hypothetical protein
MNSVYQSRLSMPALMVIFITAVLQAGPHENAGINGYDFLSLGAGARPQAMGGAYTAEAGDIYSLYWNPAGIASVKRTTFMADYLNYVLDIQKGMLAYIADEKLLRQFGVAGVYVNYLHAGTFEAVDVNGDRDPSGDFTAGYTEFCAAFARQLPRLFRYDLSAGVTVKGMLERIADYQTEALAVDLGANLYLPRYRLRIGGTIRNLGTVFSADSGRLPQIYSIGLLYTRKSIQRTVFVFDWNKPRYGFATFRLGVEFGVNRDFFIRGGYRFLYNELLHWYDVLSGEKKDYVRDDFNNWSAGVGLRLARRTHLDIAASGSQFESMPLVQLSIIHSLR